MRFGGIAVHPHALPRDSLDILYLAHASIQSGARTTGEREENGTWPRSMSLDALGANSRYRKRFEALVYTPVAPIFLESKKVRVSETTKG